MNIFRVKHVAKSDQCKHKDKQSPTGTRTLSTWDCNLECLPLKMHLPFTVGVVLLCSNSLQRHPGWDHTCSGSEEVAKLRLTAWQGGERQVSKCGAALLST